MSEVVITAPVLCSVEVQPIVATGVEIIQGGQVVVEAIPPAQTFVEFGLTTMGLRGPKGDKGDQGIPGPNEIGGYPVAVSGAQENDTLLLKSWAWTNTPQEALTDGGNF
jgi:hypothetical protein